MGVLSCSSGIGASFHVCLKLCLLLGNMLPAWEILLGLERRQINHSRDWKWMLEAELSKIMNSKTEQINPATNLFSKSLSLHHNLGWSLHRITGAISPYISKEPQSGFLSWSFFFWEHTHFFCLNLNKFPTELWATSCLLVKALPCAFCGKSECGLYLYYTATQTTDTRSVVPIQHLWSNSPQGKNGVNSWQRCKRNAWKTPWIWKPVVQTSYQRVRNLLSEHSGVQRSLWLLLFLFWVNLWLYNEDSMQKKNYVCLLSH